MVFDVRQHMFYEVWRIVGKLVPSLRWLMAVGHNQVSMFEPKT